MINGKQAMSLLEQTAKYVQACGKRTILECKPQSLKGINISELHFAPQLETDILQLSKPVKKTFSFGKTNAPNKEITKLPKDYLEIACLEDNFELSKRVNVPNPQTIGFPENYLTLNLQGQKVIKPHLYIEGFEVKKI